ncbi:MAG: DUF418 domain-containing protein [Sandaracinaceae bacterium]
MPPTASAARRVEGLDLARAVAILAMVLINFQVFLLGRPDEQLSEIAWRWLVHVPSGRSSSLFVTLAGAGIALMARSPDRRAVRWTLLKRALFLLVAGNLLILVWYIDILHFYAFFLAIAALVFLDFTDRQLLGAAAAIAAFAALLGVAFEWPEHDYWSVPGMALDVFVEGIHPVLPWIAFVCVGLWVGRQDLADPGTRRRIALGAGLLAVGTELGSAALMALSVEHDWPTAIIDGAGTDWSPEPLYVVGASSTAVLAITACVEVVSRWGTRFWVRALVATGQLSFTIYLWHALVGVGIPRWAMGLEDALPWRPVTIWWAVFCALTVLGAWAYRRRFRRGPVEWVMRKLCGTSPPGAVVASRRPKRAPPAWPWAFVVLGALGVLAIKIVGLAHPTIECTEQGTLTGRATGELTLSCPRRSWTLEVPEAREVTLETHSGLDVMIELWGATKRIAVDDDSGAYLNARLVRTLRPGTYRVVVRPYDRSLGPFALEVD